MKKITIEITTKSNLFIGGVPTTFEIGGVDLHTVTDYEGNPLIPASSLKGVLRRIIRDLEREGNENAQNIEKRYENYLSSLQRKNEEQIKKVGVNIEKERLEKMRKRFEEKSASAECLFGIQGFNDIPKLIFNDLILDKKVEKWYSIDSKTSIDLDDVDIKSNPRTYKTVRPGISFYGDILFYRLEELGSSGVSDVKKILENALSQFNTGIYRLGNSGSRGYGRIEAKIVEESM